MSPSGTACCSHGREPVDLNCKICITSTEPQRGFADEFTVDRVVPAGSGVEVFVLNYAERLRF